MTTVAYQWLAYFGATYLVSGYIMLGQSQTERELGTAEGTGVAGVAALLLALLNWAIAP